MLQRLNRPQTIAEWMLFGVFCGSLLTMLAEIMWWTMRGY